MTPTQRKSMANIAINQALMEMACADPDLILARAARQLVREASLQILHAEGSESAAEFLYMLADEWVGVK